MSSDSVTKRILAHIRRVTGVKDIELDRPLKDYSIDSITSLELVMDVEREFNITIPDEKIEELVTARAVIDMVQTLLALHVR
jgi:acyl carrier protein